jgi:hypothetical protein
MSHVPDLPLKLDLALKVLSLSRVGLSQRLGVDKSLVGRWLSGAVHPTEHNLSRLTGLVSEAYPAFRMADWFGSMTDFAQNFGVEPPVRPSPAQVSGGHPLLSAFLETVMPETAHRASAYEGLWRTARPSVLMRDRIFHDYGMVRRGNDGMLEVVMEGSGLTFSGWLFPIAGNVFVFLFDATGRTPMTVLFKGVSLPTASVLDGILMLAALDADRTPAAVPVILERVGDVSGDRDTDDARFARMVAEQSEPLEPLCADELKARLFRDIGPAVAAKGGDPFLIVSSAQSLSRGITTAGLKG